MLVIFTLIHSFNSIVFSWTTYSDSNFFVLLIHRKKKYCYGVRSLRFENMKANVHRVLENALSWKFFDFVCQGSTNTTVWCEMDILKCWEFVLPNTVTFLSLPLSNFIEFVLFNINVLFIFLCSVLFQWYFLVFGWCC